MTHPAYLLVASTASPYFDTHPTVRGIWVAMAVIVGVVEVTGVLRRRAGATRRDRGSQVVIRLCAFPGALLMVLGPRIAPAADIHPALLCVVVGLVVFGAGEAMRVWARITLGRYFTYSVMTSADQPVITKGPYRLLRHPSYTGILLLALGAGAVWANWLGLAAITVAALAGLTYRIHIEEKALLEDLGDRYRTYAEGHKRLVPFVW